MKSTTVAAILGTRTNNERKKKKIVKNKNNWHCSFDFLCYFSIHNFHFHLFAFFIFFRSIQKWESFEKKRKKKNIKQANTVPKVRIIKRNTLFFVCCCCCCAKIIFYCWTGSFTLSSYEYIVFICMSGRMWIVRYFVGSSLFCFRHISIGALCYRLLSSIKMKEENDN